MISSSNTKTASLETIKVVRSQLGDSPTYRRPCIKGSPHHTKTASLEAIKVVRSQLGDSPTYRRPLRALLIIPYHVSIILTILTNLKYHTYRFNLLFISYLVLTNNQYSLILSSIVLLMSIFLRRRQINPHKQKIVVSKSKTFLHHFHFV